jgi:hypothetical protein
MGNYDSGRASDFGGINIEARREDSINGIRFDSNRSDPSAAGDVILYRGSGSSLRFWDGSSVTTLGSAGGLVNYSLNDAYDDGNGITVDGAAVLLAGSHVTNDVLSVTGTAAVTGALINLAQSGSGVDIDGTSSTWQVTAAGAATFASVVAESITAAANLTLEATGAGTIGIGATSSGTVTLGAGGGSVVITNGLTISGTADANKLTITAGDILVSNGKLALTNDDTDSAIAVTANSVTSGNALSVTANGITTGSIAYFAMTEAGVTSGNGSYIECYDSTAGATQFIVSDNGATTITGSAVGTAALTLTAGDITVSDGNVAITSSSTADVFSITDDSLLANNALIVKGSGAFTGTGASSFVAITPTGASTGTGLYIALAAATTLSYALDVTTSTTTGTAARLTNTGILTGVGAALSIIADAATTPGNSAGEGVVNISADGLTTGTALNVESLSNELMTSGNLADFAHSASGTTVAAKTGAVVRVTSSITESGTSTQDYDVMSVTRTSIHDTAGTLTAQGSILYLENVATETGATLTDTVNGLEILMDTQGTGDGVKITHSATAGKALNIVSAATTVSSVLITGSGVKANNKADLEVTNSGATAAGGSILRVTNTGTPAAATSYLVDFDYSGATMTNNPVAVFIDAGATTAAGLQVTGSGASAGGLVELNSTATGALGAVLKFDQTANSAAAGDVIGRILFTGQDDANAAETYGRIDCVIRDVAAAGPDAAIILYADKAGTNTRLLTIGWDDIGAATLNGVLVGDNAASAYVSSLGNFDLILKTGNATTGNITLTDAANGNITITPDGSGKVDLANAVLMSKTESIGAGTGGAIDVVSSISELATDVGGDAYQLADGTEGQLKFIILKTDGGGDAVITPANPGGYSTITMADAGDSVTLLFTNAKWYCVGQGGLSTGPVLA